MSNKHLFADHRVEARDVKDFLARYYKPDRYTGRGWEYAAGLLKSHQEDFARDGFDVISHHDSVTGQTVAFFGDAEHALAEQPTLFDIGGMV